MPTYGSSPEQTWLSFGIVGMIPGAAVGSVAEIAGPSVPSEAQPTRDSIKISAMVNAVNRLKKFIVFPQFGR
jgi:hypothetical protein